ERRNDMTVQLKVVAVKTKLGWSLVENPHKLFRKSGEVEMRGADVASLRFGEWVKFQVGPSERKDQWRATRHHRLYAYYDLSSAQSVEEARQTLTFNGVATHRPPGIWMIRINGDQVVQIEFTRSGDDLLLASHITTLPAYEFDQDSVISMPTGSSEHLFYDLGSDAKPCYTYDWTPESGYIERVIRRLAGFQSPQLAEIISWLQQHADERTGRITVNPDDVLAAHEALRSGELAKRLNAEQTLLRSLVDALTGDARMAGLLERERNALIEQERNTIHTNLEMQLAVEMELQRDLRTSQLEVQLKEHEAASRAQIKEQLDHDRQEAESAIAAYQAAQKVEIDKVICSRLAALEQEKAELTEYCANLSQSRDELILTLHELEIKAEDLNALVGDLSAAVTILKEQREHGTAEVERLKEISRVASEGRGYAPVTVVPFYRPKHSTAWCCSEAGEVLKNCALLTSNGKKLMEQFIALSLAGEIPLLVGPDVADFLLVAESLVASGRSARLEADPTILTFEDLWVRAGTGLPTSLAQGLTLASSQEPCSVLGVIDRAERSAARFWLPALTDRARRGDLPRRLLLCATVEDDSCEEAEALRGSQIWLPVKEAIAKDAATVAPLWLSPSQYRELDPGDCPVESIEGGLNVAQKLANRLGLVNTLRAVRSAAEVATFYKGKEAIDAIARMNTLFLNSVGSEQPAVAY
ncbi:hypothetical protein, partial [Pseudomonas aeruginosa]